MTDASLFKGMDESNAQRNSEYFRAGRYLTYVNQFKVRRNDEQLIFYIFELVVLKVLDPSAASAEPLGPHGVGHQISWVMAKHKKPTMPNLKAALMVMTNVPQEQVTAEFSALLASDAQPLHGICVEFDNKVIQTKSEGRPFTRVTAKRLWASPEVRETVGSEMLDRLGIELEDTES